MIGVIYARYSSDNQREESIEGQLRECRQYADRNGITLLDPYIDRAYSAKTDNRPSFLKMVKDSAAKKFDTVIVMYTVTTSATVPVRAGTVTKKGMD